MVYYSLRSTQSLDTPKAEGKRPQASKENRAPIKVPNGGTNTLLSRLQKKPALTRQPPPPPPPQSSPSRLPVLKGRREPTSKLASQVVSARDLQPHGSADLHEVLSDLASLRVSTPHEVRQARTLEDVSQLQTKLDALTTQLKTKVSKSLNFLGGRV